jgi:predicted TPR repeat methyltransferase
MDEPGITGFVFAGAARYRLSPQMSRRAVERDVYDSLLEAELTGYLQTTGSRFGAITCADSLIYFGELEEVLCGARRVLNPDGFLCFTVEKIPSDTGVRAFELQAHGRYRHRPSYVRRALEQAGFAAIQIEDMHARAEAGEPVASLLVTARVTAPAKESSRGSAR